MIIGYARVSSTDQNLEIQLGQLTEAGAEKIFAEKKSGRTVEGRDELDKCIAFARDGDTLIVTKIDRLARSMADFCDIVRTLQEKKVGFQCLNPNIDTTGPVGEMTTKILMAVAEFEWHIRKERQREGIERARANGVYAAQVAARHKRIKERYARYRKKYPDHTMAQIAKLIGVDRSTLYRLMPGEFGDLPMPLERAVSRRRLPDTPHDACDDVSEAETELSEEPETVSEPSEPTR